MNKRTCSSALLFTGASKCPFDPGKVRGAIVMPRGVKLPAELTGEKLEELCHAPRAERAYPILPFVEYAKNGGEPQTNANGYGPTKVTDYSARVDTFTMESYDASLNASLSKYMNTPCDVYFFDDKCTIYGVNDGSGVLGGFPMSTIYPTAIPHPTSSALSSLTVSFAYESARDSFEKADYMQVPFDPRNYAVPIVPVMLSKESDKYYLVEAVGGYDLTPTYGPLIAKGAASVLNGATAATYNEADGSLSITAGAAAEVALKDAAALYAAGIIGIEQAV